MNRRCLQIAGYPIDSTFQCRRKRKKRNAVAGVAPATSPSSAQSNAPTVRKHRCIPYAAIANRNRTQ